MIKNTLFKNLNELKYKVKDKLLTNQNLLKLLRYSDGNPTINPDIDNPQSLLDDFIYLKPRAYSTQWSQRGILLFTQTVDMISDSRIYADVYLIFTIAIHNEILILDDGRDRMYCICEELHKMFNANSDFGVGRVELNNFRETKGATDYYTADLVFSVTNFNK
ncbi:MAG: hypothetical protein ACRC7N_18965 [Clostridium sp.]